jgi:predicted metal-binding membrane protein
MSTCRITTPSKAPSHSWPEVVTGAVLAALCLAAWGAMWLWMRSPAAHVLLHGAAPPPLAWSQPGWYALLFTGGWTLMTAAMMLPTSIPLLVMFRKIVGGRATAPLLTGAVVAGYLGVWAAAGAVLQMVNWLLQAGVRRVAATAWIGAAVVLGIAGLFQFSELKYACLEKCRSPLSFIIRRWRGGSELAQSLRLGAEHGMFCVGCCWSLMLLMFVVGAGSLGGMLVLGLVMAVEKNFAWGARLSAPLGVALLAGAAASVVAGVME